MFISLGGPIFFLVKLAIPSLAEIGPGSSKTDPIAALGALESAPCWLMIHKGFKGF